MWSAEPLVLDAAVDVAHVVAEVLRRGHRQVEQLVGAVVLRRPGLLAIEKIDPKSRSKW